MPCGAVCEREQKSPNFPVKFPVSREFGPESGSHETPPTAIESATFHISEKATPVPGKMTQFRRKAPPENLPIK